MKPKKSSGDVIHAIAKGSLSSIPIVGGMASELFALAIASPLERRRDEWLAMLEERLRVLEIRIDTLAENESFVSVMLQASQIALRNHEKEKLAALRNAVVNTARGVSIEDSLLTIFLNIVDSMSPWHILLLRLWQDPDGHAKAHGINYGNIIALSGEEVVLRAFPELKNRGDIYELVMQDLYRWGLIRSPQLHTMATPSGVLGKGTNPLGDDFLRFIGEAA